MGSVSTYLKEDEPMNKVLAGLALSGAVLGMTAHGVTAASMKETIHLKAPTGMSALHMSMGVAKVTYTAHDATVKITAQHLPAASMIHGNKFYVVWLKQGNKSWYVGDLKFHGGMAGLTGMVMVKKFQDLNITAEKTAHPMHAMGTLVLSGMSTHR
jgi:hypothetical protein